MVCPICHATLGPNEKIELHWNEERQWFVLFHLKAIELTYDFESKPTTSVKRYQDWCAQADNSSTHLLRDEWRKLGGGK